MKKRKKISTGKVPLERPQPVLFGRTAGLKAFVLLGPLNKLCPQREQVLLEQLECGRVVLAQILQAFGLFELPAILADFQLEYLDCLLRAFPEAFECIFFLGKKRGRKRRKENLAMVSAEQSDNRLDSER